MGNTEHQKIKVLHLIKSLGRGGAEMLLPESLKLHDQSRFEFHYIYFLPWKNQMVKAIEQAGGKVTCLSATNNLLILLKAKAIARYVRHNNIQLIHAHLPWAGFVGRWMHRITGTPLLYTEHNKQERYHFLTRWLNRLTFRWQTLVIAVSGDVEESICKNINPAIPVKQVLNGVNTEFFRRNPEEGNQIRQQYKIPADAIVVGTVAVFRFQKRLKEWIDVFQAALVQHPNLVGVMVGDGPLREELVKHIHRLKLESKFIMPGLQTEVRPWYSAMDIFMMTSVFEGLPIALLEAMSMECAVVTTDAGGIKEVITHEVNGLMKAVDQYMDLSDDVIALSQNQEQRQSLASAGRQRVMKAFGMTIMVKELEKLYSNQLQVKERTSS
jgi:L-malate glycosyltransferase